MSYKMDNKDLSDALEAISGTPAFELDVSEWGNGTLKPIFDGKSNHEEILSQLLEGARQLRLAGFSVEVSYQYRDRAKGRYVPYPHGKVSRRVVSPLEAAARAPSMSALAARPGASSVAQTILRDGGSSCD